MSRQSMLPVKGYRLAREYFDATRTGAADHPRVRISSLLDGFLRSAMLTLSEKYPDTVAEFSFNYVSPLNSFERNALGSVDTSG